MEVVRNARFVQGFLFSGTTGTRSFVGCDACTRALILDNVQRTLLLGWWSLPWGLTAPAVVAQNLREAWSAPDADELARYLARQGIDIDDVTLDQDGRSAGDRALVRAVGAVLHEMTWADGSVDEREVEVGVTVAVRMLGPLINAADMARLLGRKQPPTGLGGERIGPDGQLLLLKAACAVAAADGVIDDAEIQALRRIGSRLELSGELVESFVEHLRRDATEEARIRADAATVLGVDPYVSEAEVRTALRKRLLECGELGCAHDAAAHRERIQCAYKTLVGAA